MIVGRGIPERGVGQRGQFGLQLVLFHRRGSAAAGLGGGDAGKVGDAGEGVRETGGDQGQEDQGDDEDNLFGRFFHP